MPDPIEYRPSRLLRAAAIVGLLVFAGFLAIELLVGGQRPWVAAGLGLCTLVGIAAVLETRLSRVILRHDAVFVRDLFRSRTLAYDQIEAVQINGGAIALKMKSGTWQPLPEWLSSGAAMSAHHRIKARLGTGARDA